MSLAQVSDKGQVTLPADIRKALGLKPKSKVEIELRDNVVTIRPVRSVREVRGMFREAAKQRHSDWETIRSETERLVAEEVMDEDR